jgi:tripartite-type tricarboxylate transporter receptor subunit TctC
MKLPHRRQFLHLAAGAAALPLTPRIARAQAYPMRPVRIIVANPAGGGNDIVARLIGQFLSERLGQSFIIENRPGAGGNIGTEAVIRAPADGYTLLLVAGANTINATLYEKLNFNFISDIAPVAGIGSVPNLIVVHPSAPAETVSELIAYAKSNPGKLNMASGGIGTPQHIAGELFKMMTSTNIVHVPYRGAAPALTDLLGGQVQMMFATMTASIEYVRARRLRALAVTGSARSEMLKGVPTVSETVPGFEASALYGIGAPKSTPTEIVERLNKEINAALTDPKILARLSDLGASPIPGSPAEFGRYIAEETEKWGKVIRAANIKPE